MIYFRTMDVTEGHFSIAHCVSSDLRFGLGVAKQIREKFGQMDLIATQDCSIGRVAITCPPRVAIPNPPNVAVTYPPRFIFHLFSKSRCFGKPSEASLEKCLWELKRKMIDLGVKDVQAPRLAAGLDRMRWERVLVILDKVFNDTNVNIHICTLPESHST